MRALITREHPEPLHSLLQARGIQGVHVPLVSLQPTHALPPRTKPTWILITSGAVTRFVPDLAHVIGDAKVVAVGPRTASELADIGVTSHRVGTGGGLEALSLIPDGERLRSWYIGARVPSSDLNEALQENHVTHWPIYHNTMPTTAVDALSSIAVECITFASGSAVRAYVQSVGLPSVPVVVLGGSTLSVAQDLGINVGAVASETTMRALADAVAAVLAELTQSIDG